MAAPPAAEPHPKGPWCPHCRQTLTLTDIGGIRDAGIRWTTTSIVYCKKCGGILGGAAQA
jgi:hypothetical protein